MDALRGIKLLHKEGDKNLAISIAVDFDTTKHLSEASIKRRQVVRDRLIMKDNEKREEERRKAEEEEQKKEKERFDYYTVFVDVCSSWHTYLVYVHRLLCDKCFATLAKAPFVVLS